MPGNVARNKKNGRQDAGGRGGAGTARWLSSRCRARCRTLGVVNWRAKTRRRSVSRVRCRVLRSAGVAEPLPPKETWEGVVGGRGRCAGVSMKLEGQPHSATTRQASAGPKIETALQPLTRCIHGPARRAARDLQMPA
jgi:hypothetical protein